MVNYNQIYAKQFKILEEQNETSKKQTEILKQQVLLSKKQSFFTEILALATTIIAIIAFYGLYETGRSFDLSGVSGLSLIISIIGIFIFFLLVVALFIKSMKYLFKSGLF